jgi:hypothetical protein
VTHDANIAMFDLKDLISIAACCLYPPHLLLVLDIWLEFVPGSDKPAFYMDLSDGPGTEDAVL